MLPLGTLPSLSRLRTFTMVAAMGSALAASARLRISQPAVSYSLDRLESELGVRLLERNVSGSYVTPAGRLLHNRTTRLFFQIVEAVRHVIGSAGLGQDKAEALAGKLRDTQVRALIAIWRVGSFRAAARELGVTEPSLQRPARESSDFCASASTAAQRQGWKSIQPAQNSLAVFPSRLQRSGVPSRRSAQRFDRPVRVYASAYLRYRRALF